MSESPKPSSENPVRLTGLVKRRRALSIAATAITLAGCSMTDSAREETPTLTAEQRQAEQRVRSFTSGLEMSLDRVDRERLRAAAERKPTSPSPPEPSSPPVPSEKTEPTGLAAATPPAPAPAATNLEPVILASTDGTDAAHTPLNTTTPPARSNTPPGRAAGSPPITNPIPNVHATPAHTPTTPPTARPAPTVIYTPVTTTVQEIHGTPAPEAVTVPAAPITPPPGASHATPSPSNTVLTTTPPTPSTVISPIQVEPVSPPEAMGSMTAAPPVVRAPVQEVQVAAATPPAPEVTPPAPPPPAAPAEPTVEQALAVLQKNIAAQPTLNTALALALLNSPDPALSKNLSEADRQLLTDLLAAFETMKSAAPGEPLPARAAPLVNATKKWQSDADLTLPRLVLANRVDSFGVFSALEPRFEQGKRHTVIIYCEVANFASKKGDDGWYTTKLAQQETLITDDGLLVWRPNAEEVEDRSLNQRHDFYLVKKLTIPENLAAGKYTLRMSVTDRTSNKISVISQQVEIVGK